MQTRTGIWPFIPTAPGSPKCSPQTPSPSRRSTAGTRGSAADFRSRRRSMTHPGQHPMLFQLLNEMDGLAEDADVTFILTTNRADLLEPALASRPGRVDQAVAFALPDAAARRPPPPVTALPRQSEPRPDRQRRRHRSHRWCHRLVPQRTPPQIGTCRRGARQLRHWRTHCHKRAPSHST